MARLALLDAMDKIPYFASSITSPLEVLTDDLDQLLNVELEDDWDTLQQMNEDSKEGPMGAPMDEYVSLLGHPSVLDGQDTFFTSPLRNAPGGLVLLSRSSRSLLQTSRSLLQSCGSALSLQNASAAAILSAAPSTSSCTSAAVSLEAEQMALLLGAVANITQATSDMQDYTSSMLATISGLNDAFDNTDNIYSAALTAMYAQISDAYGNDTAQLQVVNALLDSTLAVQTNLSSAINASATLLLAAAINGQTQANQTILDTESVLRGYGLDSLQRWALYFPVLPKLLAQLADWLHHKH